MDVVGDHPADLEAFHIGGDLQGGVGGVLGGEEDLAFDQLEALADQVAAEFGHDDGAVLGLEGPVHHQQVAGEDAGTGHGIARHAEAEGGGFVANEVFVEVETLFEVVIGGGEGARGDAGEIEGDLEGLSDLGGAQRAQFGCHGYLRGWAYGPAEVGESVVPVGLK